MHVKKQQLEPDLEQWTGSKLGKEYIMRNAGLDEAQSGVKIARRNINNLRYVNDITLMAESDESERGEWKSWLKTQHSEN